MTYIVIILISLLFGFKVLVGSFKQLKFGTLVAFISFALMAVFLLFRLGRFPNVFIDEGNCAYESWCLAHYGVDSNLMHAPVYFQSFAGQGQSVIYAYLAAPFLKYFGYSLLIFRLPLVLLALISTLNFLRVIAKYYSNYLPYLSVVLCTCPYLLTEARYGMDCNVAVWVLLLAISAFIDALNENRIKWATIKYSISFLILGLVAYSYNVSWLYLPFLMIGIVLILIRKKVSLRVMITPFVLLLLEIMPILIFAIRSNYAPWNKTKRFLFFTSPALQQGRTGDSIIHPITIHHMASNVIDGFKQLFINGDGLAWNSLPVSIAFYLFASLPFLVGIVYIFRNINEEINQLFIALFISNILIFLIVKPNYNHWMFAFIPIIYTIASGLLVLVNNRKYIRISIMCLYAVSFLLFAKSYFNTPRFTGMYYDSFKGVNLVEKESKGHQIYIQSNDSFLMQAIRDFSPFSPYTYQSTKDHPYSQTNLQAIKKCKNYKRITRLSKYSKGSLILVNESNKKVNGAKLVYSHVAVGNEYYNVFEVVK